MPGDYKMRTQAQTIYMTNPSLRPYSVRLKYFNDFLLFFIKPSNITSKAFIRNPLSLLSHERSCLFCVQNINKFLDVCTRPICIMEYPIINSSKSHIPAFSPNHTHFSDFFLIHNKTSFYHIQEYTALLMTMA